MRDAGTGFAVRRTGLVDTDEQTTFGNVVRYLVKRSFSDSETILKSISKDDMVDGVKSIPLSIAVKQLSSVKRSTVSVVWMCLYAD